MPFEYMPIFSVFCQLKSAQQTHQGVQADAAFRLLLQNICICLMGQMNVSHWVRQGKEHAKERKTTDQTPIKVDKWKTMANLLPKWIPAVFKETWTGLFFIKKEEQCPSSCQKQVRKQHLKLPGERFSSDMKNYTLLFTLTIQGMLQIDKVRARTLFLILNTGPENTQAEGLICRKPRLLQSRRSVLMCSVHDLSQSALVCVYNPAAQSTHGLHTWGTVGSIITL